MGVTDEVCTSCSLLLPGPKSAGPQHTNNTWGEASRSLSKGRVSTTQGSHGQFRDTHPLSDKRLLLGGHPGYWLTPPRGTECGHYVHPTAPEGFTVPVLRKHPRSQVQQMPETSQLQHLRVPVPGCRITAATQPTCCKTWRESKSQPSALVLISSDHRKVISFPLWAPPTIDTILTILL